MSEVRDERQVFDALSKPEQQLLRRVLEIERSKLHLSAYDGTEDLIAVVREILP